MADTSADRAIIRELIQNWVVWRDSGDWERLRTVWHADGRMNASWLQGTADEFIEANRKGWEKGLSIYHLLGGSWVEVSGNRAVSQTKMSISQRATLHGILCDVNCTSRHYDFWEKRAGVWGLVVRETIFDKDRLDPVTPGVTVPLEPETLALFPEGYRHLAYLQTKVGYNVRRNMPGTRGREVEELYARGAEWLRGGA